MNVKSPKVVAGGRGNKIVDVKDITRFVVERMTALRNGEYENKRINQFEKELAKQALEHLDGLKGQGKGKSQKLSIEVRNRYITAIRKKVKELGFIHPVTESKLISIAEKNTDIKESILNALTLKPSKMKFELNKIANELLENGKTKKARGEGERIKGWLKKLDVEFLVRFVRTETQLKELNKRAKNKIISYDDKMNKVLYSYAEITPLIPALLVSKDWKELALGVAMATGRRCYEVCYLSEFKAKRGRKIEITGFAKKRGDDAQESQTMPCLADPKLVVEAVEKLRSSARMVKLRSDLDELSDLEHKNDFFNNSVHKQLNETASIHLGMLLSDFNGNSLYKEVESVVSDTRVRIRPSGVQFKITRDLYVWCCHNEYEANGGTAGISTFIEKQLNHTDLVTGFSYKKVEPKSSITKKDVKTYHAMKPPVQEVIDRVKGLTELLKDKFISENANYTKALNHCIECVKNDDAYIVSTTNLRKAISIGEGKFKAIIHPRHHKDFVDFIKSKNLDQN